MADEAKFTVKTVFDNTVLSDMQKETDKALGNFEKKFTEANKSAQITPTINHADLKKQIADIEKELNRLNKQRAELVVTVPKSAERDKEFARISKQIQDLVKEKKTIQVEVDTKAGEESLARMYDKISKGKIEIPIDQKKLRERIRELDKELKDLVKRRDILVAMPKNPQRDKALDDLDKKIKEVTSEKQIKVDLDKRKLAEANAGLTKLAKTFGLVSAAVTAANAVFAGLTVAVAGSLDKIDKSSQKLGLSIQTYQETDNIAIQIGASVDGFTRSLRTLAIPADADNKTL